MALKYGFFDSFGKDRVYNAEDFNRMFDGLITEGVFATFGGGLMVEYNYDENANSSNYHEIKVNTGKAWFDHTWIYVDSPLSFRINKAQVLNGRCDAVIILIDKYSRTVNIQILNGEDGSYEKPEINRNNFYYYSRVIPLAYLMYDGSNVYIENMIGTSECPIVTGILETVSADTLFESWDREFNTFLTGIEDTYNNLKDTIISETKGVIITDEDYKRSVEDVVKDEVIADSSFKSSVASEAKTLVINDSTYKKSIVSDTEAAIKNDSTYKASLVSDTENSVKNDTAYKASIASDAKSSVINDEDFKSELISEASDKVKDELSDDENFKKAVANELADMPSFVEDTTNSVKATLYDGFKVTDGVLSFVDE